MEVNIFVCGSVHLKLDRDALLDNRNWPMFGYDILFYAFLSWWDGEEIELREDRPGGELVDERHDSFMGIKLSGDVGILSLVLVYQY